MELSSIYNGRAAEPRFVRGGSRMIGWVRTLTASIRLTEVAWVISFIVPYSFLLAWLGSYLASLSHLSVLGWVPIILGLTPLTAAAYRTIRQRSERYLRQLMDNQIGFWDIDKAINEYLALFKRE